MDQIRKNAPTSKDHPDKNVVVKHTFEFTGQTINLGGDWIKEAEKLLEAQKTSLKM